MNERKKLHHDAMAHVDDALAARRTGLHDRARAHFADALNLERLAAEGEPSQPSRCILFRSAAWLALEADDAAEAERLAACGLADREVPEKIKAELRAVAEEARLRLGRPLPPPTAASSLTLHLEGPEVGHGVAAASDIDPRRDAATTLVVRKAEERRGLKFRPRGAPPRELLQQLQPRVQYAPGSVVVQISLGGDAPELWDQNAAIVEDLHRCLAAFGEGGVEALHDLIPEATYRENFGLLAARLAPDGARVTSVDVHAATSNGSLPVVRLRRPAPRAPKPASGGSTVETLIGELRGADETTAKNTIKLVLADGGTVRIQVQDAAMEDIVRPLYGHPVRVTVDKRGRKRTLLGAPERVEP